MIHNKNRVESFSDAVFAFAATLIVVSFEVPEDFSALHDLITDFISFAVSFGVLFFIWKVHYNFFQRIDFIDNIIIFINAILLFVILFYVYPMKFIANFIIGKSKMSSYDELVSLFTIYGLGFFLIFLCMAFLYRYSVKKTTDETSRALLKYYSDYFSIFYIFGIFSIILSQLNIGIRFGFPGFVYAFLGPICWFHAVKFGVNKKKSSPEL